jgi:hypothetical protein
MLISPDCILKDGVSALERLYAKRFASAVAYVIANLPITTWSYEVLIRE